jgi:hypothetical protein
MPKSNDQRAATRYGDQLPSKPGYGPTEQDKLPSGDINAPGGVVEMLSDMAPKGVKPETMRKSGDVLDVRQPAEGEMGTLQPDYSEPRTASGEPKTSDDYGEALRGYLKGKVSNRDIDEMFPAPSEKLRGSKMAADLGVNDVEHAYGLSKLKQAFQTIKEFQLGRADKKLISMEDAGRAAKQADQIMAKRGTAQKATPDSEMED